MNILLHQIVILYYNSNLAETIQNSDLTVILSTSNRIPTRGQYQKRQSCILPVASFLGNNIVWSNCTIVWYKCSDATIVTWCHNSTIWHHNSSTIASINRKYIWLPFFATTPSGYSIWGSTENCTQHYTVLYSRNLHCSLVRALRNCNMSFHGWTLSAFK